MDEIFVKNEENFLIGSNIRRVRKRIKMKTSDLVREVNLKGVSMNIFTLSKIEANTQHIKASQLWAIKEILQCSYEDLIEGEDV